MPIIYCEVLMITYLQLSGTANHLNILDNVPSFAAVATSIHCQRSAHCSRYASQKFGAGQPMYCRISRDLGAGHTRLGIYQSSV